MFLKRPGPVNDNDPIHAMPELNKCLELIRNDLEESSKSKETLLATDSKVYVTSLDLNQRRFLY